jgi:hypothetical protein
MTHEDKGHYAKKHPPDKKVTPEIAEAVKAKTSENQISCARAFSIVEDMNIDPSEAGFTIDSLEISITKCQLGLYGYGPERKAIKPVEKVVKNLEDAIKDGLEKGRLPCKSAWKIAEKLNIPKTAVSAACEALNIKIGPCQLGAF